MERRSFPLIEKEAFVVIGLLILCAVRIDCMTPPVHHRIGISLVHLLHRNMVSVLDLLMIPACKIVLHYYTAHHPECYCGQCEKNIRVEILVMTCLSSTATSGEQKDDVRVVNWISFLDNSEMPPLAVLSQTFCFSGDCVHFVFVRSKLSWFSPRECIIFALLHVWS